VEEVRGVAYYDGPDADPVRHRLDLFLPQGHSGYPVALLVHGGAWQLGDNRCCGLYSAVGRLLASQGGGAVLPNYRLSPGVRHPGHVRDVARAFAWAHAHAADYGGRPDQLFLAGHSSGGHLVSLLATDEKYLRAEGLRTADIRGVVSVSGVYRIPAGSLGVRWGGVTPTSFRLDEVFPLRGVSRWGWGRLLAGWGLPLSLDPFDGAFGTDSDAREDASPVRHVRPELPPFLLVCAEQDLPTLPEMAEEFHRALRGQGCDVALLRVEGRNHNSVLFRAVTADDPVARAVLAFIRQRSGAAPPAGGSARGTEPPHPGPSAWAVTPGVYRLDS
jgi:acetyl esterase/lipase